MTMANDYPTASDELPPNAIAVIGMAGRFPGADSVTTFWDNLRRGEESIATLSEEALTAAGVSAKTLADPAYVRRAALLDGIEEFDAEYFGMTPYTARMMDPQQRLFLQTAWHAFEDSGYDPATYDGAIGVFAASTASGYLMRQPDVAPQPEGARRRGHHRRDVQPGLAERQGLPGDAGVAPVQPARTESLGADRLLVVAGRGAPGVPEPAVRANPTWCWPVPPRSGCRITSATATSRGRWCRRRATADRSTSRSDGTIFGSGVAAVVLKPLQAALDDGDRIHAVIRGSAINNDGSVKMTYAAPALAGQAEVIAEAHAVAGVDSSTIGFVETHGTGTPLGDPIEVEALRQAFEVSEPGPAGPVRAGFGEVEHRPSGCGVRRHRPDQDDPLPEEQGDSADPALHRAEPRAAPRAHARSWFRTLHSHGNPTVPAALG